MKKLVVTTLILYLSCSTQPEVTDCAGIVDGTAVIDDCGLCTGGTTGNVGNYLKDCAGECGGDTIEDECGYCGGGAFKNHIVIVTAMY